MAKHNPAPNAFSSSSRTSGGYDVNGQRVDGTSMYMGPAAVGSSITSSTGLTASQDDDAAVVTVNALTSETQLQSIMASDPRPQVVAAVKARLRALNFTVR